MKRTPDVQGTPARDITAGTMRGPAMVAAAVLGIPALMVPQAGAQAKDQPGKPAVHGSPAAPAKASGIEIRHTDMKHRARYTVLGVGDGHTIFQAADGSMFYLDPATGDKRAVASDYFLKGSANAGAARRGAGGGRNGGRAGGVGIVKFPDALVTSIVGRDASGNPVLRNDRNEIFTLDPRTGDKVFVSIPR